jgi:hypothetical protein
MAEFSQTRSFNLGIAQETSVEAALIYNDFAYAQQTFGDGWFYRSYEQLLRRLPVASERTMRNAVNQLEAAGWIEKKIMKVDGSPVCHYKICRILSAKTAETMESAKTAVSINSNNKTTKKVSDSKSKNEPLLLQLISLVNPKEKATAERHRALSARLKDYTEEEIIQSAIAFSKSEWHRNNKQMSIDNLLAPSKFGRWYAQRNETPMEIVKQNMVTDSVIEGSKFFPAAWPKGEPEYTEDDDDHNYFRGVMITPQNQDEVVRIRKERSERDKNAS